MTGSCAHPHSIGQDGTTLLELLVAMAVFLIIGGAAFSLFNRQQIATTNLQGEVGLSLALRNSVSQLQMDLANAGNGYFQGINIPTWPVGVVIVNHFVAPGTSCYDSASGHYTSNCFDQINIITADNSTSAIHPTDSTGNSLACTDTSSGFAYGQVAPGLTLTQTAAMFKQNDQVLLMNGKGTQLTTAVLKHDATVSGPAVVFTFINATNADGSNNQGSNDPLDITTCSGNLSVNGVACGAIAKFGKQYCGTDGSWIIKLAPIQYYVDTTTEPGNPKLMRAQKGGSSVVMDQIIGFKLGAAIWNSNTDFNNSNYYYDPSQYVITDPVTHNINKQEYNFTLVRSVRVSTIGRTAPNFSGQYTYRNTFDGGPYQVQGVATVVNPRNMSMNDN